MTPRDNDRETYPPGPEDEAADAFADACRELGEWPARLENLRAVAGGDKLGE